ncbi:hypothetical protein [Sphingomonas bacterium]|uniref:hypothetical protein n=1 Tax=Sphingomonas bacterium TaxID=1895847 RepID=UPI0026293685|nr:hypothetical protein [Sphingomonas bacterium]
MPVFAVLQAVAWLVWFVPAFRANLLAGPTLAATVGVSVWLLARRFASASSAANDNAPPLAALAARRYMAGAADGCSSAG